ncbi:uncharacterized protein C1orf131 [Neodiprion virginianus]|uniref:uncharacterized protein C1orf131 n=1 Tax=Neodiprion virginianus TaxID=2961670 RepID=UPI001EE7745E|nr:uncharacterized protein C1orf131 [Neodiprion virginianus]
MDEFIVTRSATLKRNANKDFISVSYTAPKKKRKSSEVKLNADKRAKNDLDVVIPTNKAKGTQQSDVKWQQEIQMKRARFDVIKFGMSGFDGAKGEEAKIALAVKLGAKPPKKKAKNYKELKLERQKLKERAQKKEHMSELGKNVAKQRFVKKPRRRDGLLNSYGVVTKTPATIKNNKRHI